MEKFFNRPENEKILFETSFFIFGFAINFIHNELSTAAQDILEATDIPTAAVVILLNGPYIIVALVLPYVAQKIPPRCYVVSVFVTLALGTGLSALSKGNLQIFGLGLTSLGSGVAEVGFLSTSAFHLDRAVYLYSCGAGAGLFFGPLFYTAFTSWLCISPTTTLATMLVLPLVILIFHIYVAKKQEDRSNAKNPSRNHTSYTPLKTEDETDNYREDQRWTYRGRLYVIWRTFPLGINLFMGDFCEILILQSVATTLAFPNSPFDSRTHYVYYTIAASLGELLGRSYGVFSTCLKKDGTFITRHTWIFSGILIADLIFLVCAAWYRFLPHVWVVLLLMFIAGLNEGALFVNSFSVAGRGLNPHQTEFSRALLTVAYGSGILVAGFMGLSTETGLKVGCLYTGTQAEYCFTRSMTGWNQSSCGL